MTAKKYLKIHPEKYVMVTVEFGAPIYIAHCKDMVVQITNNVKEAEKWSALDNTPTKLAYHKAQTGYKNLEFKLINSL